MVVWKQDLSRSVFLAGGYPVRKAAPAEGGDGDTKDVLGASPCLSTCTWGPILVCPEGAQQEAGAALPL